MRKIALIIDDSPFSSSRAGALMFKSLACELESQGNFVYILAPKTKVSRNRRNSLRRDKIKNLDFIYPNLKDSSNYFRRTLLELGLPIYCYYRLSKAIKIKELDLVISYSPSIFFGPLIFLLRYCYGKKTYLVLRDIFPEWAISVGLISRKSPIAYFFKIFEYIQNKSSFKIGAMSKSALLYLNDKGLGSKSELLYNWYSPEFSKYVNVKNNFNPKSISVIYGGAFGVAQNPKNLIKLASKLNKSQSLVKFNVYTPNFSEMHEQDFNNFEKVNIHVQPSINRLAYLDLISKSDFGLIVLDESHTIDNIPGKLMDYLYLKTPIIGIVNEGNELIEILNDKVGVVNSLDKTDLICKKIINLVNNPLLYENYSKNTVPIFEELFSTEVATRRILMNFDINY